MGTRRKSPKLVKTKALKQLDDFLLALSSWEREWRMTEAHTLTIYNAFKRAKYEGRETVAIRYLEQDSERATNGVQSMLKMFEFIKKQIEADRQYIKHMRHPKRRLKASDLTPSQKLRKIKIHEIKT